MSESATTATVKPILFSGPMVRALLDGRKSQTRRVLNPQPSSGVRRSPFVQSGVEDGHGREVKLRYDPGDLLWVRETWCQYLAREVFGGSSLDVIAYKAGRAWLDGGALLEGRYSSIIREDTKPASVKWRPAIHMPRWASRLTLEVTGVKVERLQEISETDALAEGISVTGFWRESEPASICFSLLWDSINAKRPGASWEDNPWVVGLTFRVHKTNVDAFLSAREAA